MTPARGEVLLWVARAADARITPLLDVLTEDERARAARFFRPRDARTFSVARALIRIELARAVGRDPADVDFALGPHGKPRLVRRPGEPDVRFNLSHSGDVVAFALTLDREVGVDVEERRVMSDLADISDDSFSPRERAEVLARPDDAARHRAFFACWSRKEAVIKALGFGLAFPLDAFDVDVDPDAPSPRILASRDPRLVPEAWSLVSPIGPENLTNSHGSALLVAGERPSIRQASWPVTRPDT